MNNFAVTSAGLGEALTRSASALDLAGNTIQQTAGMVTGIVEVTQDPEKAGSALKVLSLRLRGMKGQLEDLGEETDENVENISKMQGQILNMTKGKVNIFDASGNFRSTYEIMKGIADVWDELSSIDQANLLETIAGKNRANDVAALLSNWENVEAAVKSASAAEGSAARENAKYVDSVQGRLDKLTTSWQSFANTFMNSDLLKGGISGLTGFVEILEKIVDKTGTLGTIGLGAGIFGLFKNRSSFSGILGSLSAFGQLAAEAWRSGGKLTTRFKDIGKAAGIAGGDIAKSFTGSLSGMIGGIGLAIAAIGLIISAYKNYKEEISKARQETIQTSDAFLDSASSFERAYIKYSGKTNLTVEEEAELESAIKGTVDALGDKSSALQNAVNSSNDYVASLQRIARAELEESHRAATQKLNNAKLELKDAAFEWFGSGNKIIPQGIEANEILYDLAPTKFYDGKEFHDNAGRVTKAPYLQLPKDATTEDIIEYYELLIEYQNRLSESGLETNQTFDLIGKEINTLKEYVNTYKDGIYDAAKAQYQLANGIPKTVDEYLKMRESILKSSDIKNLSLNTKNTIASTLDSEYSQIFDLSSAEVQAKKFIGLIKGYGNGIIDGTNEIGTVETFLNMRTAVNGNECTVGEYLSQFDEIDKMTENWSDEEKELLNTSFGLDTDTIKQQYAEMQDYLKRQINISPKDYTNLIDMRRDYERANLNIDYFLDSLTADELAAVIDIRTEIDWENTSAEDIRKQIEDQAKLNEALSFKANIEADTTALETLNDILAESASAMGLSSEAIDSLKTKYADLDSFNPSTLFEATGNGVKVNREELEKLEKEYNDLTKTKVQKHLDTLADKYNDVTAEIDKCTNAGERAELLAERETYADKIEELATYQAQLEGVTGAYQDWINAQNAPEDYEGYEAVATSREDIEDEIDRGFIGNSAKKYIDLLSGEDLDGKSVDDYAEAWEKLDKKVTGAGYSVNDFFTVNDDGDITATGIDRFFKSLQTDFEGSVAKFDEKTKKWSYDFGSENLEKIKEKWGIGIEAIELLLEAAASAGYDIDWDGILDGIDLDTSNFETLVSTAEAAQIAFNKLKGVEDVNFNFTATGVEEAASELEKARSTYIDLITNKDGTINLNAKGAEEMRVILATLLIQKQQLEDANIAINIDTSGLDESQQDIANAINAVKNFREKYKNLEIAVTTGQGIEEAKTELNTAMTELQGLGDAGVDIAAELILGEGATAESLNSKVDAAISAVGSKDIKVGCKLDETALGTLNSQVLANFTPEATVKITGIDDSLVGEYTATEKTANGKVKWDNDTSLVVEFQSKTQKAKGIVDWANNVEKVKTQFSAAGTVKWTSGNKVKVKVVSEANGTANANGTTGRAFRQGNWGINGSGTALVGELGMETLVRGGHFYTIGDNGAEFIQYRPNDIIFNHKQTEELFKYGKVLSDGGRGKVFADGTAYVDGSALAWGANAISSKFAMSRLGASSNSASSSNKKKTTKTTKSTKTTNDDSSAKTKTETVANNNSVKTVTETTWGASGKDSNFSQNRSNNVGSSSKSSSTENKFEETIDWIETILDRAERAIDKYEQQADNVYKTWSKRNKALENEIDEVSNTISLYEQAKNEYLSKANAVGLDSKYATKVRNGSIGIEDFAGESDEKLVEKIKNYQDLYNKYLDCIDKIDELKEQEASLYSQRFNHVSEEYDNLLQGFEHTESMLNEYISQSEENGYIVSKNYYNALIDNEEDRIAKLRQEQADLIAERDKAVADGKIDKYSEAWYDQCAAIDNVTQAIESGTTALIKYNNAIRDIDWEIFDTIQQRITDITAEADFFIELMSNKKLYEDDGKLTSQGFATVGLYAQNYNTLMYQADLAGKEAEKLKKQLDSTPYDKNLESRYREMIELQREYILEAENQKNSIVDLVQEGIEFEIDALDEKIQKYEEALDTQKDLYDYQKRVEEQTKNIASIQKQISAYEGDNSEEAKAKIQELRVSLEEAEADLQETEYEKFISDQSALLDNLFIEYESLLNERLDNTDDLINQVIDTINAVAGEEGVIATALGKEGSIALALSSNATGIKTTLETEAGKVGTTLSAAMNNIWSGEEGGNGGAKSILEKYGNKVTGDGATTLKGVLDNIKANVAAMTDDVDKDSLKNINANKTKTSAIKDPTKQTTTTNNNKTNTSNNSSNTNSKAIQDKTLKGIAAAIWVYGSKAGWEDDPTRKNKLTNKLGADNAKKVQKYINDLSASGKLTSYWYDNKLKLADYSYSAFKLGAKKIDESQLAWTQEAGQEYIVRPSDGAILTPVAKGDSILTSAASSNIWNMANSPAEFIKDNLNLGSANAPNNSTVQNSYSQHIDNVVFRMDNVKNYDEMLNQMQRDPNFERLVESMSIGKLSGKSSLTKGKAIR